MDCRVGGSSIHYSEQGRGMPLLVLHGASVDHREVEAAVEAVVPADGYRRIYPDLPGMGRTTASESVASNEDVVELLASFVDRVVGGPVLLLGHSYGAYLARGLAAKRPGLVLGLALLCPVGEGSVGAPEQAAVSSEPEAHAELEPGHRRGFDDYFVVRTRAMARRYRDHVVPGMKLADEATLRRIFGAWRIDVDAAEVSVPVMVAAGRRDATVGYKAAIGVLACYPQASIAVFHEAGHALPHEQPDLLRAVVGDWLGQVDGPRRDPQWRY